MAVEPGVHYGAHGGVTGLAPGAYVCVVHDDAANRCLVRAIDEAEILLALADDESEYGPPGWMRARYDDSQRHAQSLSSVGLPLENSRGLPGLMTEDLDTDQLALVQCLSHTKLGRRLEQWSDPTVYLGGIVARCELEVRAGMGGEATLLPLAARFIQEAAEIDVAAHRIADAGRTYASHAGRPALNTLELAGSSVLERIPVATPSMRGTYDIVGGTTVSVELKAQAADVCRALNLIHGRVWIAIPSSMPEGGRAGCYVTPKGFRFDELE